MLESLYERLALAFFRGITVSPPEGPLRAAVVAAGLSAVIVIGDCELAAPDLARLLETFGGCAFLLTSRHRTLYRSGATHEISPSGPPAVTGAEPAATLAGTGLLLAEAGRLHAAGEYLPATRLIRAARPGLAPAPGAVAAPGRTGRRRAAVVAALVLTGPPDQTTAGPAASPATPAGVVQAYVAAINARDYTAAWKLGGDHLSPSFTQFVAGFAGTAQDSVTIIAAAGSSVLVNLTAVQTGPGTSTPASTSSATA